MKLLVTILISVIHLQLYCQTKVEAEKRIDHTEIPRKAFEWLDDAYEGEKKIKWYAQFSLDQRVYEAKFKWKSKRQSIEFDTLGNILNIEIQLKFKALNSQVKQQLNSYFEETYTKYRLKKIQIQYLGSSDDLEDIIDENEWEHITTNYEIEFFGKTKAAYELYEGLFNDQGQLIERRVIKLPSSDILKY